MDNPPKTTQHSLIWVLFYLLVIFIGLNVFIFISWIKLATWFGLPMPATVLANLAATPTLTGQRPPVNVAKLSQAAAVVARPVFDQTVEALIGRFNSYMVQVDATKLLPSIEGMERLESGDSYVLRHGITNNIMIYLKVDSASGYPFLIGVMAGAGTDSEVKEATIVLLTISSMVFGKGEAALTLSKVCGNKISPQAGNLYMFCTNPIGILTAGIATIDTTVLERLPMYFQAQ